MGLLRFLLILIAIYIVFRFLARVGIWFLHRYLLKKMGQNGGGFYKSYQFGGGFNKAQQQAPRTGETTVQGEKPNPKISDNEGEYVDYEEVK